MNYVKSAIIRTPQNHLITTIEMEHVALPITPHPQRSQQHTGRQAQGGHGDAQVLEHTGIIPRRAQAIWIALQLAEIHGKVSVMPRFGTKSLLIAVAITALWLATFTWPDESLTGPGSQIRKAMLVVIFVASGVAAVCCRGRSRAFWSAFSATMLLLSADILNGYFRPDCYSIARSWSTYLSQGFSLNSDIRMKLRGGIAHGLVLGIATVAGLVAAWVYDQSRKSDN